MQLEYLKGFMQWPLRIECKFCPAVFIVSLPTDIVIRQSKNDSSTFQQPSASIRKSFVTFCPCCKTPHEIAPESIPTAFIGKIPYE